MVGASLIPNAKIYSLFFIIPLILIYSRLVDILRRHHLLYCFALFHGLLGLIFYFILLHPIYGISNSLTSPNRLAGWAFYFFMESFDAFFSTTFWSFADSINKPKDAKNYYGLLVAGSKFGGIFASLLLYLVLHYSTTQLHIMLLPNALLVGSLFLVAAAGSIYLLIKKVPDDYMHGYEMAYQLEKRKPKDKKTLVQLFKSCFDGLIIILKNPYVLGIFSLVIFCEIIVVIFDFWMALYADKTYNSVGQMTEFYASYYLIYNVIGLAITLLGTTPILRILGLRAALFAFPIVCIGLFISAFLSPTAAMFYWIIVALRAFNYALNHPTREVLYIPTTKNVKYKAKTWTDAFGTRIAKSMGSGFNVLVKGLPPSFALYVSLTFSLGLASFWIIIAYFLGKTLQNAIDQQKVIGSEEENTPSTPSPKT
jgi:AAA family ATP:ADP antiporter